MKGKYKNNGKRQFLTGLRIDGIGEMLSWNTFFLIIFIVSSHQTFTQPVMLAMHNMEMIAFAPRSPLPVVLVKMSYIIQFGVLDL